MNNNVYNLTRSDVRGFATSPGMEIIGKYDSEDENNIYLRDALAIHLQEVTPGKHKLELLPPSFFYDCDEKHIPKEVLPLNKHIIMFCYAPRQDVYDGYCSRTNSIQPVSAIIKPR